MRDEFANRQAMHLTVLDYLNQPASKVIWEGKTPLKFTDKVAEFRDKVADLTTLISAQQAALTGRAADKDREEEELEDISYSLSQALVSYFEDNGRVTDAAQIDLTRTAWRRLRDTELLAKVQLLQGLLSAALAADATGLADYAITPADATALAKEYKDYADLVASPSSGISTRAARTKALRPSFREASALLSSLDGLIERFRRVAGGSAFIAGWRAARIVRDLGGRSEEEEAPTPPTA